MKITIEPETDTERKQCEPRTYAKVCEFALVGTQLEGDVLPRPIVHTHGDTLVLFGKLAEAQERLRRFHDGPVDR